MSLIRLFYPRASIMQQAVEKIELICTKCNKSFSTVQMLNKHINKNKPCIKAITCAKCNKEFARSNDLKKHQDRKTSCEPIQGDPTIKANVNTCIYCRKIFKNKYNVKTHYNTCRIRNGGMDILFEEVKRLKDENKEMRKELMASKYTINATNCHFGNTFNFNFINFGEGDDIIDKILNRQGVELLQQKFTEEIPILKQISDRVVNLVGLIFRNADYKELQGIYVLDLSKNTENAYYHEDGTWKLTDWVSLRSQLLQKLYNRLAQSKEHKRKDIENIISYLFVLGDCGESKLIKKLSVEETAIIYNDIGNQMMFKTMMK